MCHTQFELEGRYPPFSCHCHASRGAVQITQRVKMLTCRNKSRAANYIQNDQHAPYTNYKPKKIILCTI